MIVDDNRSIYGSNGTMTTAIGALYDETGNIAVHEILDGSVTPTASTESQNFSVSVAANDNNTFVEVEFTPAITATLVAPTPRGSNILVVDSVAGFYPGDQVAVYREGVKVQGTGGPGPDQELDGYATDPANILILSNPVSLDLEVGDQVALLGPMPFQFGIDGADDTIRQQIESLRDTKQAVKIFGEIFAGRLDWNAAQIIVTSVEPIDADPSQIPAAPGW